MQIVVKGHRTKVPERFRNHVHDKLAKVERLNDRIIGIDVEVCKERNPRQPETSDRVQITVRSGGPVVRAEACAQDPYAALDGAWGKLEARLRKLKDKRKIHRGSRAPVSVAEATAPLAAELVSRSADGTGGRAEPAAQSEVAEQKATVVDNQEGPVVPIEMEGDGPLVVREKTHKAGPMSLDEALLAMELVGHDFYLFRDTATDQASVVYRRHGYDYGVIRLEEASVNHVNKG
ncbi:MAG: ribosome hibernation-promoting factor, HPF/YfiA family [Streptosporangiales bacterium]